MMSQTEIKAALAEQEDHIKRNSSCSSITGVPHAWREFKAPEEYEGDDFERCIRCLVSRQPLPFAYYVRRGI